MNTESGYSIETSIYTAVEDPNSGIQYLHSFEEVQGPMHGIAVNAPYLTRDFLQQVGRENQFLLLSDIVDTFAIFRVLRIL